MTQPATASAAPEIRLTLEEEVLQAAGLLDLEVEEGQGPLDAAQRKELLDLAKEDLLDLQGRVTRIDFAGQQVWRIGEDLPFDKNSKIEGMFGSAREDLPLEYILGDIRVYVAPKQSIPGASFRRMTMNRGAPNLIEESLTRDTFIEALAGEISYLLELESAHELIECPACQSDNDTDNVHCSSCGAKLPEDEGEDEEDDEPEEAETTPSN
jgi:hypothetical protein